MSKKLSKVKRRLKYQGSLEKLQAHYNKLAMTPLIGGLSLEQHIQRRQQMNNIEKKMHHVKRKIKALEEVK